MGATIGAVASILYLIFAYIKGSKQRKIDIKIVNTLEMKV